MSIPYRKVLGASALPELYAGQYERQQGQVGYTPVPVHSSPKQIMNQHVLLF